MYEKWLATRDRVLKIRDRLVLHYPGKYLLVCVNTGRIALGDPTKDDQGGHKHAQDEFLRRHGTMEDCSERWRDFLGISL